jgi:hypothetical protein
VLNGCGVQLIAAERIVADRSANVPMNRKRDFGEYQGRAVCLFQAGQLLDGSCLSFSALDRYQRVTACNEPASDESACSNASNLLGALDDACCWQGFTLCHAPDDCGQRTIHANNQLGWPEESLCHVLRNRCCASIAGTCQNLIMPNGCHQFKD